MAIRLWGDEEFVTNEEYVPALNPVKNWEVAGLAGGGYVIVWLDSDNTGSVQARVYSGNGNPESGVLDIEVDENVSGIPVELDVVGLEDGNFAVVWTRANASTGSGDQYARIFDTDGNRLYSRLLDSGSATELDPAVAALGSGFVHVERQDNDLMLARYDATGAQIGSSVTVDTGAGGPVGILQSTSIATFLDGNHVAVAWRDVQANGIDLRIYDSTLSNPTGVITVDLAMTEVPPKIVALDNDRIAVVWHEDAGGTSFDVFARIYTSSGTAVTSAFLVNQATSGIQARFDVAETPDGGFMVSWGDESYATRDIAARLFDSDGTALGGQVRINTNTAGADSDVKLSPLSDGRIVAIWSNLDGVDEIRQQIIDTREGLVVGTNGVDELYGNADLDDTMSGLDDDDRMLGLAGNDTMNGGDGDDLLFGNTGDDDLFGDADADQLLGGDGADNLDGGAGRDIAVYLDSSTGLRASLANTALNTGFAAGDTYTSIESLTGTQGDDDLFGSAGGIGNVIRGGSGEDLLRGYSGIDTLYGGEDDDVLEGGLDNDRLYGGRGSDIHDGGDGIDVAYYTESFEGVTISLANSALNVGVYAVGDTYISIENVIGTKFDDILNGLAGGIANEMRGGAGDDELKGYSGDDSLFGGEGNDIMDGGTGADFLAGGFGTDMATYENAASGVTVSLSNPSANAGEAAGDTFNAVENLRGSDFADILNGNTEDNVLEGLSGSDFFRGYQGFNTITGGTGADTFIFSTALGSANLTEVTDFASGSDVFWLEDTIFDAIPLGVLAAGRFASNTTGQAADASDRIIYNETNGFLYYDEDGNGSSGRVYFARLDAGLTISASDFEVV